VEKSIKNRFLFGALRFAPCLDSASLRSPLGTPDGGNDTNKCINYVQLVWYVCSGIALTSEVFVAADDENNMLGFCNKSRVSLPIKKADPDAFLQINPDYAETNIEAATCVD